MSGEIKKVAEITVCLVIIVSGLLIGVMLFIGIIGTSVALVSPAFDRLECRSRQYWNSWGYDSQHRKCQQILNLTE